MADQIPVVIIGGGPAGLAAGIVLASHHIPCVLFEAGTLPRDKPCGEGIMPTGVSFLRRFGIDQGIDPGEVFPFRGIAYRAFRRCHAAAAFQEGCGWGMPREVLSRALLHRASKLRCLTIFPNTRPDISIRPGGRSLITTDHGQFHPNLLIGADGRRSGVRAAARMTELRPEYQRWGARQHFLIKPWSTHVEIYWEDGIEAYVTPCRPDMVNVAFLWDRSRVKPLPGGDHLIGTLLSHFPDLKAVLNGAQAHGGYLSVGPLERRCRSPIADGVLLIGDAAGYLDPITGEGISLAFAQALALENTVVPRLLALTDSAHRLTKAELTPYATAHRRIVWPHLQITRLLLGLSTRPHLAEWTINQMNRFPSLFQKLLSLNMGVPTWKRKGAGKEIENPEIDQMVTRGR
jgi:2-polyprenyl-6-methoxyphenol hydroxylase-like FAD-dependent oxidoreductase